MWSAACRVSNRPRSSRCVTSSRRSSRARSCATRFQDRHQSAIASLMRARQSRANNAFGCSTCAEPIDSSIPTALSVTDRNWINCLALQDYGESLVMTVRNRIGDRSAHRVPDSGRHGSQRLRQRLDQGRRVCRADFDARADRRPLARCVRVGDPHGGADADIGFVHLKAGREATATLMRGFTSVRDAGGPTFALKRAIDEGVVAGPRIYPRAR